MNLYCVECVYRDYICLITVHTLKPIYQLSNHRILTSWFHHAPKHFKLIKFKAALVPAT